MKFRPLNDWILIRRHTPEEKTAGGIIIPDAARSKPTEGIIEAIGPGRSGQQKEGQDRTFVPTELKPGQHVIFIDYMAKEVTLDGREITLIQEDSILGIFEHSGELTLKQEYHLTLKKEHPPMVQAEKETNGSGKKLELEVLFRKHPAQRSSKPVKAGKGAKAPAGKKASTRTAPAEKTGAKKPGSAAKPAGSSTAEKKGAQTKSSPQRAKKAAPKKKS